MICIYCIVFTFILHYINEHYSIEIFINNYSIS